MKCVYVLYVCTCTHPQWASAPTNSCVRSEGTSLGTGALLKQPKALVKPCQKRLPVKASSSSSSRVFVVSALCGGTKKGLNRNQWSFIAAVADFLRLEASGNTREDFFSSPCSLDSNWAAAQEEKAMLVSVRSIKLTSACKPRIPPLSKDKYRTAVWSILHSWLSDYGGLSRPTIQWLISGAEDEHTWYTGRFHFPNRQL